MATQPRALAMIDGLMSYMDSTMYPIVDEQKTEQKTFAVIPSAATVRETVISNHNIDNVWNAIKSCTFEFSSIVKSSTPIVLF